MREDRDARKRGVRLDGNAALGAQAQRGQLLRVVVRVQLDLRALSAQGTGAAGARTWFTAGTTFADARSSVSSATPKFDTPMLLRRLSRGWNNYNETHLALPAARKPSNLAHVAASWPGGIVRGLWMR